MSSPAYPDAVADRTTILAPGTMLGCYMIESFLGQGGFGITYLARDTMLDMQVAIKEYLPEKIAERVSDSTVRVRHEDDSFVFRRGLDSFMKEARTLARFKHPNIVRVMGVFELNGTAYMVMEYERGQDLKHWLHRRQSVSEARLKSIIGPIIDGLEEVHRHGFIHRDIKPANIVVRDNGSPVLLDFGSARLAVGPGTEDLTALVTVGYAPLEQYSGLDDRQGPWTDIYALGAVLYFSVTGEPPQDSALRGAAVVNDKPDPLVPLSQCDLPLYSRSFCRAVDWALQFKVSARPQSLSQWRSRLFNDESASLAPEPPLNRNLADASTILYENSDQLLPTTTDTYELSGAAALTPNDPLDDQLDDYWEIDEINQRHPSPQRSRDSIFRRIAGTCGIRRIRRIRGLGRIRRLTATGLTVAIGVLLFSVVVSRLMSPPTHVDIPASATGGAPVPESLPGSIVNRVASRPDITSDHAGPTTLPDVEEPGQTQANSTTENIVQPEQNAQTANDALAAQNVKQAEAARIKAQRERQQTADRAVQRAEARRLAELQAERDAADAKEREGKVAAAREAERIAEQKRSDEQKQAAALAAKRSAVKPVITSADMTTVLSQFNILSNAIQQRDGKTIRQVTMPSERKNAYFDYVFRTFEDVDVRIKSISSSRQDQTVRAILSIERMTRSNGDIAIPPDEFRNIPIYSVREAQWTAIHW